MTEKKDCIVVVNKIDVKAKNKGIISDGFDALIWMLKRAGGRMHYGEALREIRNPQKFGKWLTEPMQELHKKKKEERKDGRH